MSLTPICRDAGRVNVFPVKIAHSALLESGYSSTGAVATNCTIALGFKPTVATTTPLNDMSGHYLLTIQKVGDTARVWKQGVELAKYTGSVGTTYAEFLSNVLTAYSGSNKGYYSRLVVVKAIKTCFDFWKPSDLVTGLWVPKSLNGLTPYTHLHFGNAVDLGVDISGNGNNWIVAGSQSDDTPTDNITTRTWPEPTILKSSTAADLVARVGNAGQAFTGGTPTASSYNPAGGDASAAFDGVTGGTWMGWHCAALPGWVKYELPVAKTLTQYVIYAGDSSHLGVFEPRDFTFEGSNDGTNWDILDTQVGLSNWTGAARIRTFDIAPPAPYTQYRVHITAANNQQSGTKAQITELVGLVEAKVELPDMEGGPDFVNMKNRDAAYDWFLTDSVRGANKQLSTNSNEAESTYTSVLPQFMSNSYVVGSSNSANQAGANFLDLCLKAGVDQGFESVTYTGNGVAGRTVPHSLDKAPTFILVKRLDAVSNWAVYHTAIGPTGRLMINTRDATWTDPSVWNNAEPTATDVVIGISTDVNASGGSYIAYLFTDSDIFKAFSYTGNGVVNDGPFVNLGGKPLAIPFWKNSNDANYNWQNLDARRNPFNRGDKRLQPNTSAAELDGEAFQVDFTSQGFKCRGGGADVNVNGNLYVGLAILESTKYSNAF